MTHKKVYNRGVIFTLVLFLGLGSAIIIPYLASAQGLAAPGEYVEQLKTPAVTRYYVAETGDGSDGLSWKTAFTTIQDALAVAAVTKGEIWVAKGVYYPDQGSGQVDNAVSSSFKLHDDVALYGGFETGDKSLSDRDWKVNLTVLSGDIDGDDITDSNGVVKSTGNIKGNNASHVVSAKNISGTAVLDGFTITAGYANDSLVEIGQDGGGFYCDGSGSGNNCNPTLRNLTFYANKANRDGGGMYNNSNQAVSDQKKGSSSPSLLNVAFYNNSASKGGAMYNNGLRGSSSPILINVIFSRNSAEKEGGALYNSGMYGGISSPSLINVLFSSNYAGTDGGAMFSGSSYGDNQPNLINVTISGNFAGGQGGGLFNNFGYLGGSNPDVRNSIIWNNQDISGSGTISANINNDDDCFTTLTYSLLQGSGGSDSWIGGSFVNNGGNIDTDPLFIKDANMLVDGNLHLQKGSPAIDAGDNTFISGVPTDLDAGVRVVDGNFDGTATVDMGAYENQILHVYLPIYIR